MHLLNRLLSVAFIGSLLLSGDISLAQSEIQKAEGVRGDTDKKRRNPIIFVSKTVTAGNVKILADSFVPNPEYRNYPVQFDFYVNRRLFSTQFRSVELPGPVGIDVGPDVTLPFTFAVVARVLHPNRHFTSVITGAVFASTLEGSLDCSLSVGSDDFEALDATISQVGNNGFTMDFTASGAAGDATVAASFTVSDATASGTLLIVRDGTQQTAVVSGDIEASESGVASLSVSSEDETTVLDCS